MKALSPNLGSLDLSSMETRKDQHIAMGVGEEFCPMSQIRQVFNSDLHSRGSSYSCSKQP